MDYNNWEEAVTKIIAAALSCTYGVAAGIVEAQPFYMAQSWGLALSPAQTAAKILSANN